MGQRQGTVTGGPNVTSWVQRDNRQVSNDPQRSYILLSPGGRGYYPRRFVRYADGTVHLQASGNRQIPPTRGAGQFLPPVCWSFCRLAGTNEQCVRFLG